MSLQTIIVKTILKLPKGVLVGMAGGSPVKIGERTLDPHFQFLAHGASQQPPMSSLDPQTARAASAQGLAMLSGKLEPGVRTEDFTIPSDDYDLPVRLYRPGKQNPVAPMMVFFHFGGGVIGDLETCHAFCSMIANGIEAPVLSVDYRLAPEHKWPTGLNDCANAYKWAIANAESLGAPAGTASIGGDSMGGNFTAILAQDLKRAGKPQPFLQLLIYPATDVQSDTPSMRLYGETYPLSADTMNWFMEQYIPEGADPNDVRLSPNKEQDLSNLAPAIVATAGFDPLVDQGKEYADRLAASGVDTQYRCYDALAHGFTAFTGAAPAADKACREIVGMLKTAYQSNPV